MGSRYALAMAGLLILSAYVGALVAIVVGIIVGQLSTVLGGIAMLVVVSALIWIAGLQGPRDPRKPEQEPRARG